MNSSGNKSKQVDGLDLDVEDINQILLFKLPFHFAKGCAMCPHSSTVYISIVLPHHTEEVKKPAKIAPCAQHGAITFS